MLKKLIRKLLTDKILLGLVMVGVLLFAVGAFYSQDEPDKGKGGEAANPAAAQPQGAAATQAQLPAANALEPNLASDFVKWWLANAMDYRQASARQSHSEALRWMSKEAGQSYIANYWSPDIQNGVLTGQVQAAFQPTSIEAEAVNPDGTVVVGATGVLLIQTSNGVPVSQPVAVDFLVKKDSLGLRIAGLYNRQVAQAAAPQQLGY